MLRQVFCHTSYRLHTTHSKVSFHTFEKKNYFCGLRETFTAITTPTKNFFCKYQNFSKLFKNVLNNLEFFNNLDYWLLLYLQSHGRYEIRLLQCQWKP